MRGAASWLQASLVLVLGLGLLGLGGCATPPQGPVSGFLSNYEALSPDHEVDGLYWWRAQGVPWQDYHALLIDPVQVRSAPQAGQQLSDAEAAQIAARLRTMLIKALQGNFPLAARPAPGVLRLRAALVNLKPVRPEVKPSGPAYLPVPLEAGQAAVEAGISDSLSGRVVGELLLGNRGGPARPSQVWVRWDQVEEAFAGWAVRLRRAMTQGGPAPRE